MTTEFGRLRSQRMTKQLPREEMERRISEFLKGNNICVLATARDGVPRATPIEYYARDMVLYISIGSGVKTENLKSSSHVSVGIYTTPYTDWTDWDRVKGAQITGHGVLLTPTDSEYAEALRIYDWRLYMKAMGKLDTDTPPDRTVLKIVAEKIELRDLALMREGYAPKQLWERVGV